MLKKFVIFCKHLISKVSVSAPSLLGLVIFTSRSRLDFFAQSLGLVTLISRRGLEDFGRDSSSDLKSNLTDHLKGTLNTNFLNLTINREKLSL